MKPCDGNHHGREALPGQLWTPEQCLLCWLYLNDPAYRALWDAPGPDPGRTRPCRHRGEARREQQCPTCRGHVRLKVFTCTLHGECTLARALSGVACCATCPDYDAGLPADPPQPQDQ